MPFKDPEAKRAYQRGYMKTYFADNPEKQTAHRARVKVNTKQDNSRKKQWLVDYLKDHPCVDCGEADLDVLEFDHVRGVKLFVISGAIRVGRSLKAIISEVAKCDVRCANCHRRATRQRERAKAGSSEVRAAPL